MCFQFHIIKCSCVVGLLAVVSMLLSCAPSHKQMETEAEISGLMTAIRTFYTDFNCLPIETNLISRPSVKAMLPFISGLGESEVAKKMNPRSIVYFNAWQHRRLEGDYVDPWGSPYNVILNPKECRTNSIGKWIFTDNVIIWSNGPNKINDNGNKDDITSLNIDKKERSFNKNISKRNR
jgi:hypothetical protein